MNGNVVYLPYITRDLSFRGIPYKESFEYFEFPFCWNTYESFGAMSKAQISPRPLILCYSSSRRNAPYSSRQNTQYYHTQMMEMWVGRTCLQNVQHNTVQSPQNSLKIWKLISKVQILYFKNRFLLNQIPREEFNNY